MIKILMALAVVIGFAVVREVGQYAEETNPFNRYDVGEDFENEVEYGGEND